MRPSVESMLYDILKELKKQAKTLKEVQNQVRHIVVDADKT